ncbi:protein MTSS 1 isoform X18 [Strigops habroptila]|uniref:protein MTSS 1 isoform X18 n=1 Tax=Strigops habroptila TaxID=2489341 RepID=UPI0011CF3536|nr:protein MTSS 1 isoform X18 [Strigops habroptila]
MEAVIEKECSALGGLFQTIISDMKGSYPVWEDFINKAGKLQSQLRTTVVAAAAFLDAFQKVADMATNTRGGTREIGSALTRMCMRHRSIESKLRQFSSALIDCLINPLQEQMEEWKKVANQLDKDHAKEYKKARQEIKKKSSDTLKLQKKAKKGRGDIQPQLDSALQDVNDKYLLLEETEKQAVRKALIEERGRFCAFISMLRPVIEEEISMLGEITHLQTISDDLKSLTMDPHKLPSSSEQVILDLKGSDYSWSYQTPPSSPSTTMSRKSSVCSSLNSVNSSDSRSSGSHSHSPSSHYRYRSSNLPQQAPMRLSSVSSHDSGFMSQDAFQSKSPSPMPPEAPNQNSSSSASSEASETCQSVSECSSPTSVSSGSTMGAWASTDKDWAKPGPYDQPMVNTLQRRKEKREADVNGGAPSAPPVPPEEAQRPRSMTVSAATRGEEMEACEELALALTRGLQLDTQRSSRDSLQCSSGYSTQTTTPCCSEDTIPSQGLPTTLGPVIVTPGVATIRRTPSTKPSVRRGTIGGGPIPIKTPVIPVKTPTVPDIPGGLPGALAGTEECPEQSPESPAAGDSGQGVTSMPSSSWSGQASVNPPPSSQKLSGADEQRQAVPEGEGEESERDGAGALAPAGQPELDPGELSPGDVPQGEDMLNAIRRGVKLKKTTTNDRSAPRIS